MTYGLADVNFTAIDWVIVAVYLGLILGLGYYANRFTGSVGNYLVAGRKVRKGLLIATFIGTELGLVSIAMFAQAGFIRGFAAFHIGVIAMVMTAIVGISGFVVYRLRDTGVMTIPEYYQQRYGRKTRIVGGVILVLAGVLNMGMFLRAGAEFIGGLTGLGLGEGREIEVIMTVLLLIVFAYVILGGVISVVITDYLQFAILGLGFIIVTIFAFSDVGWRGAVDAVVQHQVTIQEREHDEAQAEAAQQAGPAAQGEDEPFVPDPAAGFDPTRTPGFGWNYIFFMVFMTFAGVALWQPVTIRALIAASPKVAKQTYFWASVGYLVRLIIPCFWGACALAWVLQTGQHEQFFPAAGEAEIDSLRATGMYLGNLLPTVLLGLIMAGMLAAFMSTHDSYLLAWASSLVQDVISPLNGDEVSERTRIILIRIFIFLIGCFLLFWGLWYPLEGALWDYMAVTGTVYFAGAFAVVAGGLYWSRASSTGAVLAMLAGLMGVLGIVPWARFSAALENWAGRFDGFLGRALELASQAAGWEWLTGVNIALTAIVTAVAAMVVGSLLFPDAKAPRETHEVAHD